jgi:alanine racemase
LKRVRLAGLSAHIDYVAGKNSVEAEEKLRSFGRIAAGLKLRYPGLVCHAANSSVLMDFPHFQYDMVRSGNLMYGINPSRSNKASLKSPWRFLARVIALRRVPKGCSIGYASEYVAPRRMLVATVPVGYSDGLTMAPAQRTISLGSGFHYWGMLRGRKAPFIGRCAISHTLLDVTSCPGAKVGDAVALPVRRTAASHHIPRVYV